VQASYKWQVSRVILVIGIKALLDGSLDREAARERAEQTARTNGAMLSPM
jgi:hypothetical protein